MADYWANLSEATRPASAGTPADPFGLAEYLVYAAGGGPHAFYLRGGATLPADLLFGATHTHRAWSGADYGPWRLYGPTAAMDNQLHPNSFLDGIIEVLVIANISETFLRCDIAAGFLFAAGDVLDCNIRSPGDVWATTGNAAWARNVLHLGGRQLQVVAGTKLIYDNITDAADFASLVVESGGTAVDAGGQRYSRVFMPAPPWHSEALADFIKYPLRGVAAPGGWAEVRPLVVDPAAGHDDTLPRTGTEDRPATWDDLLNIANAANFRTYLVNGDRILTETAVFSQLGVNAVLERADAPWRIVAGAAFFLNFYSNRIDNRYTIRRLACNQSNWRIDTQADGQQVRFQTCYLQNNYAIQLGDQQQSHTAFHFQGCTIYSPIFTFEYTGQVNQLCVFRDCVFFGTHIVVEDSRSVEFHQCVFLGVGSAAAAVSGSGSRTFNGCEFRSRMPPVLPPTNPLDVTETTMRYSLYGLAESSNPDRQAHGFNSGLGGEPRRGPGAFYFGALEPQITFAPATGPAPLRATVRCRCRGPASMPAASVSIAPSSAPCRRSDGCVPALTSRCSRPPRAHRPRMHAGPTVPGTASPRWTGCVTATASRPCAS
jgi:hypothetical protein